MPQLLAISVGPVQEFIAAGRRTRDLWFGSYVLSEISKAVAKSVQDQGGQLIFPHSETHLVPGEEHVNVANVIVAELPTGEPAGVVKQAQQAAEHRWLEFVKDAWEAARAVIRKDIWDDQVDGVIEFYAAWVKPSGDYPKDRQKLMRLLAGRKNCRDFSPAKGRVGVPKSSLDGQRESVLKDPALERWPEQFRARLRIRQGEQLDVVGMVKRIAEGQRPYPSVSRIAADPWLRGHHNHPAFAELKNACESLPPQVLHRLDTSAFPQFQDFPYEGTAVYVTRHHEWEEELDESDRGCVSQLQHVLTKLPEPLPYLAVLVADGDKVGAAISRLPNPDANRAFSKALASFADQARTIVNQHRGVLVYAGGDDVLAFLPVDQCLPCARALRDTFRDCLQTQVPEKTPTLSVGIAIGHFMENLEDLLEYARAAEKAAKLVPGKDALAVHLHKRSGSPVGMASRWETNPDQRLTLYAELIQREALPSKLPYDLQQLIELYSSRSWPAELCREALQRDALRIIADKQPSAGRRYLSQVRTIVNNWTDVKDLEQFCAYLLIARALAEVFVQAHRPLQALDRLPAENHA
ncbi:MAG: type III-B CRISPR-associated protein Cas10/Cmr2 [Gemmataceae bacterium]|nr:type III-B CRISPR-associated protein Cas10/Cmr2 [Gemmata sp.]MDW8199067.1 type III-B CRISPR-associated protein Cas10/Cmr2 [Gemmataceae bacterium]